MKILLIDNGTKHLGKLRKLLHGHVVTVYKLFSNYPKTEDYDLVILSGGSQISILASPEIFKQEVDLIKRSKTPIIGICQGCELIAYAFGSKLEYLNNKTKGIKKVNFNNGGQTIEVFEAHHLAIKRLGKNLIALAKSDDGVEFFNHRTRPIFGLQFHPEMLANKTYGDELFREIIFSSAFGHKIFDGH